MKRSKKKQAQKKKRKVNSRKSSSVNIDNSPSAEIKSVEPQSSKSYHSFEYHRDAYCGLSVCDDEVHRIYSFKSGDDEVMFCTCDTYRKDRITCEHIKAQRALLRSTSSGKTAYNYEALQKNEIYETAKQLSSSEQSTFSSIKAIKEKDAINVYNSRNQEIISYYGFNPEDQVRFLERFSYENSHVPRAEVLRDLQTSFLNDNDRKIIESGYVTPRLLFEQSPWHRLAYHLHNEFLDSINYQFSVVKEKAKLQLNGFVGKEKVFSCAVPDSLKQKLIKVLKKRLFSELPTHSEEFTGIPSCKMQLNKNGSIKFQPLLILKDKEGNTTKQTVNYLPAGNHPFFMESIGLVHVQADENFSFPFQCPATIPAKEVPDFLLEFGKKFLENENFDIDADIRNIEFIQEAEQFNLDAHTLDKDWCDFHISLKSGNSDIPLYKIIRNKQKKARFLKIRNAFIDLESKPIKELISSFDNISDQAFENNNTKLSKLEFLRFMMALPAPLDIQKGAAKETFKDFVQLKPVLHDFSLQQMTCTLRHYQEVGLQWLTFLAENDFGGLLCDDMGLGKTHQLMALMTLMLEKFNEKKPFLVICPTTVLSHWQEKINKFAPALNPILYHSQDRELNNKLSPGDVILTSYGIIRNDIHSLREIQFSIAVFDEIQYLKNKATKSYKAAKHLQFNYAFGLTGTPIENRLSELKSLMDIVLPGYLGSDHTFEQNYIKKIEANNDRKVQEKLHKTVSPFVLRRLKDSVLQELPPKIEDIRSCELSPEQNALYRKALATQGCELRKQLQQAKTNAKIPYLHIFALLNLLKQICNHPTLIEEDYVNYKKRESGKWDLFKEILDESLNSGNKVVVFSQFLGMIDIMEHYLKEQNINFVTLTGKSTNRGKIIKEFNENDDCKVFLGSLKAGGTGIDLVGGSVVIHYDRWWNAAREDQATDRVHRIGQTRGVQVFKFVTKNTLEEKIAAIIEKKRKLLDSVIKEDSADSLKTFTKDELFELLAEPEN